jgi:hypothetical protein
MIFSYKLVCIVYTFTLIDISLLIKPYACLFPD